MLLHSCTLSNAGAGDPTRMGGPSFRGMTGLPCSPSSAAVRMTSCKAGDVQLARPMGGHLFAALQPAALHAVQLHGC